MLTASGVHNCLFLRDGKFDADAGSSAEQLDRLFEAYEASGRRALVVYFHGGLVDTGSAVAAATALTPSFEAANAFPLFVVWETGWAEVVDQNLPSIFGEKIFQRLVARVTQFVKGKLDKAAATGQSRGPGDLPLTLLSEIEAELKGLEQGGSPFEDADTLQSTDELTDEEAAQVRDLVEKDLQLENHVEAIANGRRRETGATEKGGGGLESAATLMDDEVVDEIAPATQDGSRGLISMAMLAKHVVVITASSIQRLATKRGHGVYLTIVEEILRELYVRAAGKFLWDHMKKSVDDAFGPGASQAGRRLVERLKAAWATGTSTVTFVGHSAGSIYVCRLLQEIDRAHLPAAAKANVVLLAPACTFELLEQTVTSSGDRIAGLRIFGMSDDLERRDAIAGVVYPASLLYFVSGVLEEGTDVPLVGMERFYQPPYNGAVFASIASARRFPLLRKAHATVWAPRTAGKGMNCDMESHGGWAVAAQTLESVQDIIREGYGDE